MKSNFQPHVFAFLYLIDLNQSYHIFSFLIDDQNCIYKVLPHAILVEFSGEAIGKKELKKSESIFECQTHCEILQNCYSFYYYKNLRTCNFRDKMLNGNEPLMCRDDIYTVYKKCSQGIKPR